MVAVLDKPAGFGIVVDMFTVLPKVIAEVKRVLDSR